MQFCFFSDHLAGNFLPLTLTRPIFDLRIGALTIREKWGLSLSTPSISGILDPHLSSVFGLEPIDSSKEVLWINSRFLPSPELISEIKDLPINSFLEYNGDVISANISGEKSKFLASTNSFKTDGLTKISLSNSSIIHSITYLWDLLELNKSEIKRDISILNPEQLLNTNFPDSCVFDSSENIFVGENVTIEPGCIFLAEKGSIYLGPNATIEAGSILRGSVAIGEGATVKMRARISDGTTIGPYCKVGGEVSNCIFHSYSNKGHDGYTGNSIFGQWCNLGADTNTSNLKNNYANVTLHDWKTGKPSKQGVQFLGTVMGDHSKTAINTMLNTGTICGVSSNIFTSGFPPKFIPSFSWMGVNGTELYKFDKAIETMEAVMKRRNVELTEDYKTMMKRIFESTNLNLR